MQSTQSFPILIEEGQRLLPVIASSSQEINTQEYFKNIDPEIIEYINSFIASIGQRFAEFGGTILNGIIQMVPDAMTSVIIFIITATYFTALAPIFKSNIWAFFFPKSTRHKSIKFVKEFYLDIRHFIGGSGDYCNTGWNDGGRQVRLFRVFHIHFFLDFYPG